MQYNPQKIMVTGGAGFIGSNFIETLLAQTPPIEVINVDSLTYAGSLKNVASVAHLPGYRFIHADINDFAQMELIFKEHDIDTVVHFAAESHVDRSIAGPAAFVQTNIFGTFTLLEVARKVWLREKKGAATPYRFHHVSTDEVYGSLTKTDPAFTEQTAYAPNSPYSASKASSDHLVRAYHHTYGLPVTISNCSNNYGPHQHQEKLIPSIIRCCLQNQPIPIYGDGSNVRDWLYVQDHCLAILRILHEGKIGHSYNIGGNEEHTNLELAKKICIILSKIMGCASSDFLNLIHFVTDRPGHDFRYAINPKKMLFELDWKPIFDLETGLTATVKWYLQQLSSEIKVIS